MSVEDGRRWRLELMPTEKMKSNSEVLEEDAFGGSHAILAADWLKDLLAVEIYRASNLEVLCDRIFRSTSQAVAGLMIVDEKERK